MVRERRQHALAGARGARPPAAAAQLQHDVRAAMADLRAGMRRGPGGRGSSSGDAPGDAPGSGGWPPAAASVDAFLADLEAQLVAEMLAELDELDAHEAAELEAAVAEREAWVAAGARARARAVAAAVPRARCAHVLHARAAAAADRGPTAPPAGAPCSPGASPMGAGPAAAAAAAAPDAQLPCPVCFGAHLLQRAGVVVCPRGCVTLNVAQESLSLADLRASLARVYQEHRASSCAARLAFRMEDTFGARSLTAGCGGCGFYRIVA